MQLPCASFGRRLASDLVDLSILVVPFVVGWTIASRAGLSDDGWWTVFVISVCSFLVAAPAWVLGLAWWEGTTGLTPGRWCVSTKAVRQSDGEPIGFGRAFARRAVVSVNGMMFLLPIAYGWMLFDRRRQTLYDKMFETVVVVHPRSKRLPPR
jgi:uncharacterized RDD family membrane protein YckC